VAGGRQHRDAFILAQAGAGRHDLREDVRRHADGGQRCAVPVPRDRVVALHGRHVGELADARAGHPVAQQIGEGEQRLGAVERRAVGRGQAGELVQRVDVHDLDAGALEHGPARHALEDPFRHAIRAAVAVVHRVGQQVPVTVEQREVDAPRIDAERGRAVRRRADALGDLVPQAQHVPIDRPVDRHRGVGETMRLLQREPLAIKTDLHHAPGRSAQVHRNNMFSRHKRPSFAVFSRSVSPGREMIQSRRNHPA